MHPGIALRDDPFQSPHLVISPKFVFPLLISSLSLGKTLSPSSVGTYRVVVEAIQMANYCAATLKKHEATAREKPLRVCLKHLLHVLTCSGRWVLCPDFAGEFCIATCVSRDLGGVEIARALS